MCLICITYFIVFMWQLCYCHLSITLRFCRRDRMPLFTIHLSSESCINIRNSNFYIVQRFSTFHGLHQKNTVIDYSEHSWINSVSFFSTFVTDLRCLSIWFTAIFLILISSILCYWFYSSYHCLLSTKFSQLWLPQFSWVWLASW